MNWEELKQRKQKARAKPSQREDSKRAPHACKAGGWAAALKPGALRKLAVPRVGPCKVAKHHSNGTLSCKKEPFAPERASIRRCKPYAWKLGEVFALAAGISERAGGFFRGALRARKLGECAPIGNINLILYIMAV